MNETASNGAVEFVLRHYVHALTLQVIAYKRGHVLLDDRETFHRRFLTCGIKLFIVFVSVFPVNSHTSTQPHFHSPDLCVQLKHNLSVHRRFCSLISLLPSKKLWT